jgi:N-methylhydantoinase B
MSHWKERINNMDIVGMSIVNSRLTSITKEMGITLMKTSYSTIFNEGLDFTCGLADVSGDLIASGDFQPSMIGGLPLVLKTISQEIPFHTLEPGDILIHNDPYRGGMHTPEHTVIKPIFVDGEFMGYSVAIGHIAEVGGMVPGGFSGEATEVFQEGLRIPPIKIRKAGKDVEDIWRLMLANYRTPLQNYGDFRALISAVDLGEERMVEIIREYGKTTFQEIVQDLKNYSERSMRSEIRQFPNGVFSFEDVMEDDGVSNKVFQIAVDVHVMDEEIVVDFHRSDPQARGPINGVLSVAWSATYNAILNLTDPNIPRNSGAFRPIRIVAPPGSVVNCNFPAAEVGGNTETHIRICYAIIGALSKAIPDRVMATDGGTHSNFLFGTTDPRNGEYVVCYDFSTPGWGGRLAGDGFNATNCINGNSRMNPVEVFETRFPWQIERLKLITDSGGAGQHRGGLGIEKVMICKADDLRLSYMSDRQKQKPWGVLGGGDGASGSITIQRKGTGSFYDFNKDSGKISPSKFSNVEIHRDDVICLRTPGGGGYGRVQERSYTQIEQDITEGWISLEAAQVHYGYKSNLFVEKSEDMS